MEASICAESDLEIRDREFQHRRGFSITRNAPHNSEQEDVQSKSSETGTDDDLVNVYLHCICFYLKELERAYIRCSAKATILHLKKLVATRLMDGMEKYADIDMLCNGEVLQDSYTLKYILTTKWKIHDPPLILQYRRRIET